MTLNSCISSRFKECKAAPHRNKCFTITTIQSIDIKHIATSIIANSNPKEAYSCTHANMHIMQC